jgi:hypothetical protein
MIDSNLSPTPTKKRRRLALRLLAGFGIVAALLCALAGWLLVSESGLRALVAVGEGFSGGVFRAEGVTGSLRGPVGVARLTVELPGVKVEASGVSLDWQVGALLRGRLAVNRLRVGRVGVFLKDSASPPAGATAPLAPPENLRLPLDFDLATVEVDGGGGLWRGFRPERERGADSGFAREPVFSERGRCAVQSSPTGGGFAAGACGSLRRGQYGVAVCVAR